MLITAISLAQPGDFLIVSAGDLRSRRFGEVLTTASMAKGIVGLVTDVVSTSSAVACP
jgi:4-hydroxy-4-methyl-2-oxoglutarate aldolase